MERVFLKDISMYDSGFVFGRVVYIDNNFIYLSDEKHSLKLQLNKNSANIDEGDIVKISFEKKDNVILALNIEVLNKPINNPLGIQNSPFYRLHKNNSKLADILKRRQEFFLKTRLFFINNNFLEIHTPALVESPGVEKHIEPFSTKYYDYDKTQKDFYLPVSPEFSLKEALSSGLENIFEIAKVFRNNGENSDLHRPEFYMLEWYRAFTDYYSIMEDCVAFLRFICKNIYGKDYIKRNGKIISLSEIKKVKLKELFKDFNIDLDNYMVRPGQFISDICGVLEISRDKFAECNYDKEDIFFKFFLDKIESGLGWSCPCIIYEYPAEMCALSEKCEENPLYARRFEMYICGIELANAFGELIDPGLQKMNFTDIIEYRKIFKKTPLNMPHRFLQALKYGLPPCSGIALGMERLFMLFEELDKIEETNLF